VFIEIVGFIFLHTRVLHDNTPDNIIYANLFVIHDLTWHEGILKSVWEHNFSVSMEASLSLKINSLFMESDSLQNSTLARGVFRSILKFNFWIGRIQFDNFIFKFKINWKVEFCMLSDSISFHQQIPSTTKSEPQNSIRKESMV